MSLAGEEIEALCAPKPADEGGVLVQFRPRQEEPEDFERGSALRRHRNPLAVSRAVFRKRHEMGSIWPRTKVFFFLVMSFVPCFPRLLRRHFLNGDDERRKGDA